MDRIALKVKGAIGTFFILFLTFSLSASEGQDTGVVKHYENLYNQFLHTNPQKAFQYLEKLESIGLREQDTTVLYEANYLKGKHYLESNTDSSLFFYRGLLNLISSDDIEKRINVNNNIGLAFQFNQQFDSALVYFNKCLSIAQRNTTGDSYCVVLNNLGLTYYSLQQYELSEEMFEKAYSCLLQHQSKEHLPNVLNNLFSIYINNDKKNIDTLIVMLEESEQVSDPNFKSTIYLNIGLYYYETKAFDEAEQYLKKAEAVIKDTNDINYARILNSIGNVYVKQGRVESGLKNLLNVLHHFPVYEDQARLYSSLVSAYKAKGDIDSVQYFYNKLISFKDSLHNLEVNAMLAESQKNIEIVERNAEIKNLKTEKDLLQEKERRRSFILYATIAFLILFTVFLLVLIFKERAKRKLQSSLIRQKEQKLEEVLTTIKQKNKLIANVEKEKSVLEDQQSLQVQLQQDLAVSIQEDWDIFSQYFADQHRGFYQKLKQLNVDLTNNDLRMCSLSKMRLSVKEIANVLYLTVDAVKSSRYRLRKKLDIDPDIELSDFLNNL